MSSDICNFMHVLIIICIILEIFTHLLYNLSSREEAAREGARIVPPEKADNLEKGSLHSDQERSIPEEDSKAAQESSLAKTTMNICIFGASSDRLDPVYFEEANKLGRLIAGAGHVIVFGGGAGGLMGACAKGAQGSGGRLIGIAPRFFDEPGFLLDGCDKFIFTETMAERKEKMFSQSDAYIALPGGIGTMDEFFEVLTLRQLGLVSGAIVLLNTGGFYNPLCHMLQQMADEGFMSGNCLKLISLCRTPEAALEAAVKADGLQGSIRRLEDYTK